MRMELRKKPLVFMDTETTGLDADVHEIIEIAIIAADGEVLLHTKIKPEHLERASPKALEINGYNEEDWKYAPTFEEVASKIFAHLSGEVVIAGQVVDFDLRFVNASLKRYYSKLGMEPKQIEDTMRAISYHKVDTSTMAFEHLSPLGATSMSLWATCKALGIKNPKAHTALADIETTRQVYYRLLRMTWWGRLKLRLRGLRAWIKATRSSKNRGKVV